MEQQHQRAYWVETLQKIAGPVLSALSEGRLHESMPVEFTGERDRRSCAHLEAFGRTLCGIAPWLEADGLSGAEEKERAGFTEMALRSLDKATDPASPDYLNFCEGSQPLVDAAFLAHGLVRAPKRLIGGMDGRLRAQVAAALRSSRTITPYSNNWLLFSAMVEAALLMLGEPDADRMRVSYALRQHLQWYKGDGVYGDGAVFHADYYNSFVIQPMLVDVARTFAGSSEEIAGMLPVFEQRAARYAAILERMISPEGYYPILGRSICYRFGAFQMLSQAALEHLLPEEIAPEQVRCALTAVIERVMQAPGNFDDNGWLRLGVYGLQPGLAEPYICTGSLYLCCAVFLALGLSPADPFWSGENKRWTAQKVAAGEDMPRDHSIEG